MQDSVESQPSHWIFHLPAYLVALRAILTGILIINFPGGSEGKVSAYNAGDSSSIPGPGRSPGGGNGSPLQYACLENPMGRGAW